MRDKRGRFERTGMPTVPDLITLIRAIKSDIEDDYMAYEDDDQPGILLTVGWNPGFGWDYQTGDTQYTGGAYGMPHWSSVGVYRDSHCLSLAREIRHELKERAEE